MCRRLNKDEVSYESGLLCGLNAFVHNEDTRMFRILQEIFPRETADWKGLDFLGGYSKRYTESLMASITPSGVAVCSGTMRSMQKRCGSENARGVSHLDSAISCK
jgi:hypothetical protein